MEAMFIQHGSLSLYQVLLLFDKQTIGITTGGEYGSTNWCNSYPFEKCDFLDSSPYPECPAVEASVPECTSTCRSDYSVSYKDDKHYFDQPYTFQNVESIKLDILTNGPLVATFTVYEDFYTYKSGVYQHVYGEEKGTHAVKVRCLYCYDPLDPWMGC